MNDDAQSFADNLGHKLRKLSDREMGMMQAKILQCYNDSLAPPAPHQTYMTPQTAYQPSFTDLLGHGSC